LWQMVLKISIPQSRAKCLRNSWKACSCLSLISLNLPSVNTQHFVTFQVLTVGNTKMIAFLDIAPLPWKSEISHSKHLQEGYSMLHSEVQIPSNLEVKQLCSLSLLLWCQIYFNENTQCYIPEGYHLHTQHFNSSLWPVTILS
jgi:hypothetical protein